MVLADNLGREVHEIFVSASSDFTFLNMWMALVTTSFYVYFDFAGYSDIARGTARVLGYRLPVNFRTPFRACGFSDFWRRWHISLSYWLRDYVYIPLGGSRVGRLRAHVNLWITFLLCGLWHQASWKFIWWGIYNAAFVTIERLFPWPTLLRRHKVGLFAGTLLTFFLLQYRALFVRAHDLGQVWEFVGRSLDVSSGAAPTTAFTFEQSTYVVVALCILFEYGPVLTGRYGRKIVRHIIRRPWVRGVVFGLILVASIFFRGQGSEFVYVRF